MLIALELKKRKTYLSLHHNSDQKMKICQGCAGKKKKRDGFGVTGATQSVRQHGTALHGCEPGSGWSWAGVGQAVVAHRPGLSAAVAAGRPWSVVGLMAV